MSETNNPQNRLNAARRLIARELAHMIAVREAGLYLGDVKISWVGEKMSFDVYRASLGLYDAAKKYGPKIYMEKRLFVLCAPALGESIIISKDKERSGEPFDPNKFWECFELGSWSVFPGRAAVSDYNRAWEIATTYRSLIATEEPTRKSDLSDVFHGKTVCGFIHSLGVIPLTSILTETEFIQLLDRIVEREINYDGTLRNGVATVQAAEIEAYVPGKCDIGGYTNEKPHVDEKPESENGYTKDRSNIVSSEKLPIEIRRIFAHEIGHWLAAKILGIKTTGVHIEWEKKGAMFDPSGSCTVFVGSACVTLGFERYLENRIATIAAGSLADCSMRFPEKDAIGDELYKTLHFTYGLDDFEKLVELAIIHCAKHLTYQHGPAPVGRELDKGKVLETVIGTLTRSKMLPIIQSAQYRSFIYGVLKEAQTRDSNSWTYASEVKIDISTEQLSQSLNSHKGLAALIRQVESA